MIKYILGIYRTFCISAYTALITKKLLAHSEYFPKQKSNATMRQESKLKFGESLNVFRASDILRWYSNK